MADTFTSLQFHVIFSTKNREPWLTPEIRERLFPFLGGIARNNGMTALNIGGVADHVHLLLRIPPALALSKAVQLIKGGSSKWMHETFPNLAGFSWQDGYGAFTVSESAIEAVSAYVCDQETHHRKRTFRDEFVEFLQRHGLEFDERYLLG
jgi:REP element-mobilizing transposase RayT